MCRTMGEIADLQKLLLVFSVNPAFHTMSCSSLRINRITLS